jgi:ribose 5-phosphate isomerase A
LEERKRVAGYRAVEEYVESGMVVGLGTGSTAEWVIRRIGELLAAGELRDVRGISTSHRSATLALEVGVPLVTLYEARPDVTIDGADEISPALDLIKGRGGALLREKIVAAAGGRLVVVADDSKLVERLGRTPLPVEVEPFGWEATVDALAALGCEPTLRMSLDDPARTDGGHYTVDCAFERIDDPEALEVEIKHIPGALEVGLFVSMARAAVVAGAEGTRILGG